VTTVLAAETLGAAATVLSPGREPIAEHPAHDRRRIARRYADERLPQPRSCRRVRHEHPALRLRFLPPLLVLNVEIAARCACSICASTTLSAAWINAP